jgi:tRNA(Ile)-lysidine synthase
VLWPALAARVGVRLDRRGTARLVEFTRKVAAEAATGARIPLAGGADVVARRGAIVLRPRALVARAARRPVEAADGARELSTGEVVHFGRFRFRPVGRVAAGDPWSAELPAEGPLVVRAWRAGDRMRGGGAEAARRVKRFFSDARIPGAERTGWPVVEAGGTVLWIPGVRRGHAVTGRLDQPARRYLCELIDD